MENRVKEIRTSMNLSQQRLAKLLGVSDATIARYETGTRNLSIDRAIQYGKILNIDWKEFYTDTAEV